MAKKKKEESLPHCPVCFKLLEELPGGHVQASCGCPPQGTWRPISNNVVYLEPFPGGLFLQASSGDTTITQRLSSAEARSLAQALKCAANAQDRRNRGISK